MKKTVKRGGAQFVADGSVAAAAGAPQKPKAVAAKQPREEKAKQEARRRICKLMQEKK
jgi:hypothetical protein